MHVLLDLVKEAATPANGTINQSEEIQAENRAHQDDLQRKMSSLSNVIMDALDAKESHTPAKNTGKTQDKNLQLEILFELSNMIVERVSVNRIFQLLVEGMHRGIALDRVMIAPLNVRTKELKVTYVLGQDTESWQTGINFSTRQLGILHTLYRSPQSLWLGQDPEEEGDSQLASLLDHGHCFVAALTIGPRMVAVVYADQSGQELTKEQFSSFRHFVQQTNFGLLTLANG
jgi:hypothetical protein